MYTTLIISASIVEENPPTNRKQRRKSIEKLLIFSWLIFATILQVANKSGFKVTIVELVIFSLV